MNLCAKCQLLKTIKLYNISREFSLMLNLFFFCYWISLLVIVNMRKMADVIQKCDIVAKRYSTNSCNSRTGTPGVSTVEESNIPLLLFFFFSFSFSSPPLFKISSPPMTILFYFLTTQQAYYLYTCPKLSSNCTWVNMWRAT